MMGMLEAAEIVRGLHNRRKDLMEFCGDRYAGFIRQYMDLVERLARKQSQSHVQAALEAAKAAEKAGLSAVVVSAILVAVLELDLMRAAEQRKAVG
jgi:hypothetical protein